MCKQVYLVAVFPNEIQIMIVTNILGIIYQIQIQIALIICHSQIVVYRSNDKKETQISDRNSLTNKPITVPAGKIPERIVKSLRSMQRKCLKIVIGLYNSTSTKVLEHESSVLPIDIYLKQKRVKHVGLSKDYLSRERYYRHAVKSSRPQGKPRTGTPRIES